MASKRILIVALALAAPPMSACKKRSNTTEQVQSPSGSTLDPNTTGDPNAPNPNNAQAGSAMGTEAAAVGAADNPMVGSGSAGGSMGSGSAGGSMGSGSMGSAGSGSAKKK